MKNTDYLLLLSDAFHGLGYSFDKKGDVDTYLQLDDIAEKIDTLMEDPLVKTKLNDLIGLMADKDNSGILKELVDTNCIMKCWIEK